MKLSTSLVKRGTVGLQDLRDDYTTEENQEAYLDIRADPRYKPCNGMVAERFAAQAKALLDMGFTDLTGLRRGQAYKILNELINGANWDLSHIALCAKVGISRATLHHIEKQWPYIWHFSNLLTLELVIPKSFGRVLHASCDAAVHGNDRDRRLYFELFGGLRQKQGSSGGTQIIFVQDSMDRPQVIEGSVEPEDEP